LVAITLTAVVRIVFLFTGPMLKAPKIEMPVVTLLLAASPAAITNSSSHAAGHSALLLSPRAQWDGAGGAAPLCGRGAALPSITGGSRGGWFLRGVMWSRRAACIPGKSESRNTRRKHPGQEILVLRLKFPVIVDALPVVQTCVRSDYRHGQLLRQMRGRLEEVKQQATGDFCYDRTTYHDNRAEPERTCACAETTP
jgi:hypothetical protein